MDILDIRFWAGTEASLHAYLAAVKRMVEAGVDAPAKGSYAYAAEEEPDRPPRLFSRQGDIAVITISGSLNNTDSWRNEYTNATGYPEIREALVYAASKEDVKAVVLDIKSGGGAVSGVTDTAELIAMIDKKVKPVHAYSDGMIASAAYWLGSSARSLDIGKVTEAGSIGVLTVHQDLSKMFADMGVTLTVLRAGEFKALGNPYEPLGPKAQGEIQAQLDQMYALFAQHVADARGVSYAVADQKMGQGRVFVGQSAVDAGLADKVTSFDALISKIQGGIDSRKEQPKYGTNFSQGGTNVTKKALTEQEIAAMAAGLATAQAGAPAAAAETPAEPAIETPAEAQAAEGGEGEPAAAPATSDAAVIRLQAQVELLGAQASAAQTRVFELTAELKASKDSVEPLAASVASMRPVVQKSVANLRVALGQSAAGVETLNDGALLAEQASLSAQFETKFKVGGVAAVSPGESTKKEGKATGAEVLRQARIASTRPNTK